MPDNRQPRFFSTPSSRVNAGSVGLNPDPNNIPKPVSTLHQSFINFGGSFDELRGPTLRWAPGTASYDALAKISSYEDRVELLRKSGAFDDSQARMLASELPEEGASARLGSTLSGWEKAAVGGEMLAAIASPYRLAGAYVAEEGARRLGLPRWAQIGAGFAGWSPVGTVKTAASATRLGGRALNAATRARAGRGTASSSWESPAAANSAVNARFAEKELAKEAIERRYATEMNRLYTQQHELYGSLAPFTGMKPPKSVTFMVDGKKYRRSTGGKAGIRQWGEARTYVGQTRELGRQIAKDMSPEDSAKFLSEMEDILPMGVVAADDGILASASTFGRYRHILTHGIQGGADDITDEDDFTKLFFALTGQKPDPSIPRQTPRVPRQKPDPSIPRQTPRVPRQMPTEELPRQTPRVPRQMPTEELVEGRIGGPAEGFRIVPRTQDGKPPEYLYRVMDKSQYDDAIKTGKLKPAMPGLDEEIHAAGMPLLQFGEPQRPVVIAAIKYSDGDGWRARQMLGSPGAEVTATTHGPIDASKLTLIAEGKDRLELLQAWDEMGRVPLMPLPTIRGGAPKGLDEDIAFELIPTASETSNLVSRFVERLPFSLGRKLTTRGEDIESRRIQRIIAEWEGWTNTDEAKTAQWVADKVKLFDEVGGIGDITRASDEVVKALDEAQEAYKVNATARNAAKVRRLQTNAAPKGEIVDLFKYLHGESVRPPSRFEPIIKPLKEMLKQEEYEMLHFDPDISKRIFLHPHYFPGQWGKRPNVEVGFAPHQRKLSAGMKAARQRKRITDQDGNPIDKAFSQWLNEGYEPQSWNPFYMVAARRIDGTVFRESQKLIVRLQRNNLAMTAKSLEKHPKYYSSGELIPGSDYVRVIGGGPLFDGKSFRIGETNNFRLTDPILVHKDIRNILETTFNSMPNWGAQRWFGIGKPIDNAEVVRNVSNFYKSLKVLASTFQHIDFMTRAGGAAFSTTGLRTGAFAKYPSLIGNVLRTQLSPNARRTLQRKINSGEAMPGLKTKDGETISLELIAKAGWETRGDTTVLLTAREGGLEMGKSLLDSLPKIAGVPLKRLQSFNDWWQKGLFQGVYPQVQVHTLQNFIVPKLLRAHPDWTAKQIAASAAVEVNKMFSTLPAWQSKIHNKNIRELLRVLIFSTNESESFLKQSLGAIRGPNKGLWLEYWVGLTIFMGGIANALHFAATGKPLPAGAYSPVTWNAPYSPFKIGYNNGWLSPEAPGISGRGDTPITIDMVGQQDTMFRWALGGWDAIEARQNVVPSALVNQANGRDFFGRKLEGTLDRAITGLWDLGMPIGAGHLVGGLSQLFPDAPIPTRESEGRLGARGQIIQAVSVGLKSMPTSKLFDHYTQAGSYTSLITGQPITSYDELEPHQRKHLLNDNPELRDELLTRDELGVKRGTPTAIYREMARQVDAERQKAEIELADAWRGGRITARELPSIFWELQKAAAIRKEGAREALELDQFYGEEPNDKFAKALGEFYGLFDQYNPRIHREGFERAMAKKQGEWMAEDDRILDYIDRNTGLADHQDSDIAEAHQFWRDLSSRGWWDLHEEAPLYQESPRIKGLYDSYLLAADKVVWRLEHQDDARLFKYLERIDNWVERRRLQLRKSNPEGLDVPLAKFRGLNPVTPEGQWAVMQRQDQSIWFRSLTKGPRGQRLNDEETIALYTRFPSLRALMDAAIPELRLVFPRMDLAKLRWFKVQAARLLEVSSP
jgi:hypothetical protein